MLLGYDMPASLLQHHYQGAAITKVYKHLKKKQTQKKHLIHSSTFQSLRLYIIHTVLSGFLNGGLPVKDTLIIRKEKLLN